MNDSESTQLADASNDAPSRKGRVNGIDRALQVLDYLYERRSPASAYAIAKAIAVPLSTAYSVIDRLVDSNVMTRRADGTLWLGPRLHNYGLVYASSLDLLELATHEMHALSHDVNETVQICGRDGDHMMVLAAAEGPGHFRVTSRVGTRVPLNWTASGRLLTGHLPAEERVALFARCAQASPTGLAPTDPVMLAEQSRSAYDAQLSVQVGESDFAVACVASPICEAGGACVATISIVLSEHKVQRDRARYVDAVKAAAQRIQNGLGHHSSTEMIASISTVILPGSEPKPTAERA